MITHWIRRILVILLLACLIGANFINDARASSQHVLNGSPMSQWQSLPRRDVLLDGFRVLSTTPSRLILDIQAPAYRLEPFTVEGKLCNTLDADGYAQSSVPGEPGLLSTGILLGIPLDTFPSLAILSIEMVDLPGRAHLCPAATPMNQHNPSSRFMEQKYILSEDAGTYSVDAYRPLQPVELSVSGMIRSQRVARLEFRPFQYNPSREALRIVRHITAEIQFDTAYTPPANVDEGFFESLLRNLLINYNQARPWRDSSRLPLTRSALPSSYQPDEQLNYKIQVDQDGIYQVTYPDLQAAGVPVDDLNPRTFKLFNQGVEIPIYVEGDEDNVFDPGDYYIFYGERITTKYTNSNIYWLSWGDSNGSRMLTQDGTVKGGQIPVSFRTTRHLEEDELYLNESASGPQNDHWYWYFLNAYSAPVTQDIPFSLQNLDPASTTAIVKGLLKGYYAEPQHHAVISLNGYTIDDHVWPSEDEYSFAIEVPASYLLEGENLLTVTLPHDGDILYDYQLVNWLEIEYDHTFSAENDLVDFLKPDQWQFQVNGFSSDTIDVFEITDPTEPIRILGGSITPDGSSFKINFEQQNSGDHRYLLLSPARWLTPVSIFPDNPSSLKDPSNEADYIIITHADFLTTILPLATYRVNQGSRVKVVDVQDVYDEFNGGVFSPQAIQGFLGYAYSQWISPAPTFVLLVGDGHYDYKDNFEGSGPIYIPPYLGEFDPWIGETVSDNRFVTVHGDDILPDMSVGRLPGNTTSEVTAMVNKILFYEQNPLQGWNSMLTFVADNADAGGNFPVFSDNIANQVIPKEYTIGKIYYGLPPYEDPGVAKDAIIKAINDGSLIVSYNGHASIQKWASEGLFSISSIGNLSNVGRFPLFFPLTCQEGYFIWPDFPSLAESVVRANDKGAIASWSPSGFGLSNGHDLLARGLYHALFAHGIIQLGPATSFAKYYLDASGPNYNDLIDTYNLLGDPAVSLKVLPFSIRLPIVVR